MVIINYLLDALMAAYTLFLFVKRSNLVVPCSLFTIGIILNDVSKLVHPPYQEWLFGTSVILFAVLLVLYGPHLIETMRVAEKKRKRN